MVSWFCVQGGWIGFGVGIVGLDGVNPRLDFGMEFGESAIEFAMGNEMGERMELNW